MNTQSNLANSHNNNNNNNSGSSWRQRISRILLGSLFATTLGMLVFGLHVLKQFQAAPVMKEFVAKDFAYYDFDVVKVVGDSVRREKAGTLGSKMLHASILNYVRINEDLNQLEQAGQLMSGISMSDGPRLMGERALQLQKEELRSMQLSAASYERALVVQQYLTEAGRPNTDQDVLDGHSTMYDNYIASRDELNNFERKLRQQYPLWSQLFAAIGFIEKA